MPNHGTALNPRPETAPVPVQLIPGPGRHDHAAGPLMYKIAELAGRNGLLRMSRSAIYEQIRAGRLRTVKQGDATFVTAGDLADYVALLRQEAEAAK